MALDDHRKAHRGWIEYHPEFPIGTRYAVTPRVPRTGGAYTNHPAVGVSWFGAAKYCNWLTIDSGRGAIGAHDQVGCDQQPVGHRAFQIPAAASLYSDTSSICLKHSTKR